jgi:hypothetical protein
MFSSHGLAVERRRWKERCGAPVPREWRLCRFCRAQVEDETHALMECHGDQSHQLVPLRDAMRLDIIAIIPGWRWHPNLRTQLLHLINDKRLTFSIAKFIYNILAIFYSVPMYIPVSYLYSPLLLSAQT